MPYPSSTTYPSPSTYPGSGVGGNCPLYPADDLFPSDLVYPGVGDCGDSGGGVVTPPPLPPGQTSPRLRWDNPTERQFQTGLDRGVIYPKNGAAVVWNGLTSVDENGGDSSTAYYIDGRPFLYLPTPKEFSASIRAYTYPDEFAPMMGLAQATDGMFLDSQMGEMFDLSYRTLIGDAAQGGQIGYKIHLVYNASVAPPGSSYASLSDSINATEFSWDIQAVPIPIPGFRPTAHVIIDTRYLAPEKLTLLEAVIYGTGNSFASLPSPAVLLDMLGYGTGITITDNGDGTWTAEGSYESVITFADGSFEIRNVDAVDHGDGSYTISSTSS